MFRTLVRCGLRSTRSPAGFPTMRIDVASLSRLANVPRTLKASSSDLYSRGFYEGNRVAFNRPYASYNRFRNSRSSYAYYDFLYSRNSIYLLLGLGGFYVYNLREAPFTHRLRFLWIPYWLEKILGDMSYRQIYAQFGSSIVPSSDPIYGKISRIMNKLLTAAIEGSSDPAQIKHLKSQHWTIHVVKVLSAEFPPNAFILPNGKIFIFSSILPICQNDDGLATVLSHELSHQLAHHSLEQLSKQPFIMALLTLLYLSTGISWLNDIVIDGLLTKPASREMESEADHIGCELMARLCFNIEEAVKFWSRMDMYEKQASGARGARMVEFFSTHPNTEKRIRDIQAWMPDLLNIRESSGCHEYQFGLFKDMQRDFFRR